MSVLQATSTSHRKHTLNKLSRPQDPRSISEHHRTGVKHMNSLCKNLKYSFNGYKGISIRVTLVFIK